VSRRPVPLDALRREHADWMRRLTCSAEHWLEQRAAGKPTTTLDAEIREADQNTRRLERRIARRKP
jgi:hypothetical protein